MMQSPNHIKTDPLRLAWLLRTDLRRGDPASSPISDWFKMWWLIHGRREYPAWANHTSLCDAGLFLPQPDYPSFSGFGMTPALSFLLDAQGEDSAFDISSDEGLLQAISWLFVHGVREHKLASTLDAQTLTALDATPLFLASNSAACSDNPELTWLMFFVWKTSANLQTQYDLKCVQDKQEYLTWFLLDGVPKMKLSPLVAPRWREWLRQPVLESQKKKVVPRATHLLWKHHQQLQRAFDLSTDRGITALAMWSDEVWQSQPELSWIDNPSTPVLQQPMCSKRRPFGVNLIGFAFGELGIGEDVRMAVAACEAAAIPFTVVNIQPGDQLRQADDALASHIAQAGQQPDQAPYALNLFCLTAFDTARVFLERGDDLFNGRFNIGWWPWELPVWPNDWLVTFDLVHEIWAATNFTHTMYEKATATAALPPTPVTLMPMPASVDRVKMLTREELGLPEGRFLFLYVFDFNSYLERKNPFGAVEAFRGAFDAADNSVGLVLKTMNADPLNPVWKNFLSECAKDGRIIVIDTTMDRSVVLGLIQSCDAYVSLHRSEGLGRTLAEAMLFGKPVIATDFSGSVDFLSDSTGYPVKWKRIKVLQGQYAFVSDNDNPWWAEPLTNDATRALRQARVGQGFHDPSPFSKKFFSPARIGSLMSARLNTLYVQHTTPQM